jgi:hypothetical protein
MIPQLYVHSQNELISLLHEIHESCPNTADSLRGWGQPSSTLATISTRGAGFFYICIIWSDRYILDIKVYGLNNAI